MVYAVKNGDDSDNDTFYFHPSEMYQTLPRDKQSQSSVSSKSILSPSVNALNRIYPKILPFHSGNPIPKQASRHDSPLKSLAIKYLKERRPSNPNLLCCDYNQADRDIARGVPPSE